MGSKSIELKPIATIRATANPCRLGMEEQGAATFLDCESHEPIYYKFTRAPFLPDLHLRMYYHEAFHGADISHKMASKSISMRKFPTEPPGETLTNKLQQPPPAQTLEQISRPPQKLQNLRYVSESRQLDPCQLANSSK